MQEDGMQLSPISPELITQPDHACTAVGVWLQTMHVYNSLYNLQLTDSSWTMHAHHAALILEIAVHMASH